MSDDFIYIHRARVEKIVYTTVTLSNGSLAKEKQLLEASLKCLVEGLKSKDQNSPLGHFVNARYRISWPTRGAPEIDGNEIVVFQGQRYRIVGITDDSLRGEETIGAYKTGIMIESAAK